MVLVQLSYYIQYGTSQGVMNIIEKISFFVNFNH